MRFYDRALSETEIGELFAWSAPRLEARLNPFTICWQSRIGKTYQLQSRSDLSTDSWGNVGASVSGTGEPACQDDGSRTEIGVSLPSGGG